MTFSLSLSLSLLLKGSAVLTAAGAAAWALRRSSAAIRHALWCLSILSIGALPVLSLALPPLELPLLRTAAPGAGLAAVRVESEPGEEPTGAQTGRNSSGGPGQWLLVAWLCGVTLAGAQLASGIAFAAIAVRRSRPVSDPRWRGLLAAAAAQLGVRRPVDLRVSDSVDVPIVWGYRSSAILLPPHALDWSQERLRTALLHEVAHIARFDCLTQTLAHVVRAFYWPHPMAWWALASLRRESEKACDDCVVRAGAAATDYARHLLDAARALPRSTSRYIAAAAGAELTHLDARVRALLDEERDRRALTTRAALVSGAATLSVSALLATAEPVRAAPRHDARDRSRAGWIVHDPVGCLIEGRFADIAARIEPAPVEARLYFASGRRPDSREFWVEMAREDGRYVAHLPKPQAKASPVRYRIEARDSDGHVAGTDRYHVVVARDASRCPQATRLAPEPRQSREVIVHTGLDSPPAEPPEDPTLVGWITHAPIGCLVRDRFPEIEAEIDPASKVAEARLYFASEASAGEYWTTMSPAGRRFVARLPKPRIEAGRVVYRIEARRTDGRLASTDRFSAVVAADESGCPEGARVGPQAGSREAVRVY